MTDAQAGLAQQTAGVCRAVWNTGLEQRREYRRRGAWMNYHEQAHDLVEAKTEHPWLAEVPGHCLQQTLMDLDKACRRHGTFTVRRRCARRWAPSLRFPEGSQMKLAKLYRGKSQVKLPKLGWVKFRASRCLDGETIRSAGVYNELAQGKPVYDPLYAFDDFVEMIGFRQVWDFEEKYADFLVDERI